MLKTYFNHCCEPPFSEVCALMAIQVQNLVKQRLLRIFVFVPVFVPDFQPVQAWLRQLSVFFYQPILVDGETSGF